MAPSSARAALETLLRARKLDTTLITALPVPDLDRGGRLAPSGHALLDRALGGGLPRGQVSELVGGRSSGRTATMLAVAAEATTRGELVALIDTLDRFDPASAEASGVRFDQLLWVRGEDVADAQLALDATWEPSRPGRRRETPMGRAVGRALKALALVLSSGGFGVVVLDMSDVPGRLLASLPFTTWMRLQRLVAGSDTAVVLVADAPLARSSGGATVRLSQRPSISALPVPAASSFRDRVLANRRPFVGTDSAAEPGHGGTESTPGHGGTENTKVWPAMRTGPGRCGGGALAPQAAGVWAGEPAARRFRGLAAQARVQAGLRTSDCTFDLVR